MYIFPYSIHVLKSLTAPPQLHSELCCGAPTLQFTWFPLLHNYFKYHSLLPACLLLITILRKRRSQGADPQTDVSPKQGRQVLMWFSPPFFFLLITWHHLASWTTVLCCCIPSKVLVEREPRVTAGLVATSSVPTVLPHQWSSGIAGEAWCESCTFFSVDSLFSSFQLLPFSVWVHYFLSLPCLFITLSPVVLPPR